MANNELKNLIFNRLIHLYIKKAVPLGSKFLKKKYFRNLADSTIRLYLKKLVEEKYLITVKKSVGRVPTDKGWKHYWEINKNKIDLSKFEKCIKFNNKQELIDYIASKFNLYYIWQFKNEILEGSLEYTLKNIEFADKDTILKFLRLMRIIKKEFLNKLMLQDEEIKILIGQEMKLENADDFSFIGLRRGENKLICLNVKRMDYPVIYGIFNKIIKEML